MAGGQYHSKYQKGIINRYYEHQDTIYATKLGELVSDIAIAEKGEPGSPAEKKLVKQWKSAHEYLLKCKVDAASADVIVSSRDQRRLAEFVGLIMTGKPTPKLVGNQLKPRGV